MDETPLDDLDALIDEAEIADTRDRRSWYERLRLRHPEDFQKLHVNTKRHVEGEPLMRLKYPTRRAFFDKAVYPWLKQRGIQIGYSSFEKWSGNIG